MTAAFLAIHSMCNRYRRKANDRGKAPARYQETKWQELLQRQIMSIGRLAKGSERSTKVFLECASPNGKQTMVELMDFEGLHEAPLQSKALTLFNF